MSFCFGVGRGPKGWLGSGLGSGQWEKPGIEACHGLPGHLKAEALTSDHWHCEFRGGGT